MSIMCIQYLLTKSLLFAGCRVDSEEAVVVIIVLLGLVPAGRPEQVLDIPKLRGAIHEWVVLCSIREACLLLGLQEYVA